MIQTLAGKHECAWHHRGKAGPRKLVGTWKAIPAVLALAALAVGAGALRAPAQQATPPAAPAAPAAAEDTAHPEESAPQAKTPTIRTTVELVNVPVTAVEQTWAAGY